MVRLFPAWTVDPDAPPIPLQDALDSDDIDQADKPPADLVGFAADVLADWKAKDGGQSELQRVSDLNLTVAAECYWWGRAAAEGDPAATWEVLSVDEVQWRSEGPVVLAGTERIPVTADDVFIRVWRRHPRHHRAADAVWWGTLDDCDELLWLAAGNRGKARSRMAANGVLLIPGSWRLPKADQSKGTLDEAVEEFIDAMVTPIGDPGSAVGALPIVLIGGGGKDEGEPKHVTFDRPIDKETQERMKGLVAGIIQGCDFPPEIVQGLADLNHWTAWQVPETDYQFHLQPGVRLQTEALTSAWLRPAALEAGFAADVADRLVVWDDPSAIVSHPNRAKDFMDANKLPVPAVGVEAVRRAIGASDDDAPTDEEIAARFAIATRSTGTDGGVSAENPLPGGEQSRVIAASSRMMPALVAARTRDLSSLSRRLADMDRSLFDRLHVACDAALTNALRVAGARLRSKANGDTALRAQLRNVRPEDVGRALGRDHPVVAEAGDPLDGVFDGLADKYDTWVSAVQRRARQAVSPFVDADDEAWAARHDTDRERGWGLLLAALLALASRRLFDPADDEPPNGEHDPSMAVQAGVVRRALAAAGGHTDLADTPAGGVVTGDGAPVLGVATGPTTTDVLAEAGVVVGGWAWTHGGAVRPFQPHVDLDGTEFADFTAPVLRVGAEGDWLRLAYYMPGDHAGCTCSLVPTLVEAPTADQLPDTRHAGEEAA
ncbi:MAG TPA: hypothetical protein VGB14_16380 [Acidimicrobiales bacterium]